MKNKKLINSLIDDEDGYDTITTVDASGDFTIAFVPRRKKAPVSTVEVLDEQLIEEGTVHEAC